MSQLYGRIHDVLPKTKTCFLGSSVNEALGQDANIINENGTVQPGAEVTAHNLVARKATIASFDLANAKMDRVKKDDPGLLNHLDDKMVELATWKATNPKKEPPLDLQMAKIKLDTLKKKHQVVTNPGSDAESTAGGDEFDINAPNYEQTAEHIAQVVAGDIHAGLEYMFNIWKKDPEGDISSSRKFTPREVF